MITLNILKTILCVVGIFFVSYGKGFSGYNTAMEVSKSLFLSSPNAEEVALHKSQLNRFINSSNFQNLSNVEKRKVRYIQKHSDKYLNISKYLDECEERLEYSDRRSLISQMRAGLSSVNPCDEIAGGLLSGYPGQNIEDIVNEVSKTGFQNEMYLKSLENTGRAIIKYQYQFGLTSQLSPAEITRMGNKLCGNKCSEKRKKDLIRYLQKVNSQTKTALQQGFLTQYSAQSAVDKLNERTQSLEQALENIGLEKKKKNPSQEKVSELYDLYSQKYIAFASDTLGSLLLTDVMKKETGTLINLEDVKTVSQKRGSSRGISRPRHRNLVDDYTCRNSRGHSRTVQSRLNVNLENCTKKESTEDKLKQAVEEAIARAYSFNTDFQEDNDIQEMIKKNPIAAGQSLIKYPNMAQHVCDEVIDITQTDERNEKIFNYAETTLNTLDKVSLALMVTGVGAIGGSALRGISGTARAGSLLLKASVLGGISSSAIRAVSGGAGVLVFNEQRQELINSRMAEAQTSEDIAQIRDIEEKLGKSSAQLIDAGMDFLLFGVLSKVRKTGKLAQLGGKPSTLQNKLDADKKVIRLNKYLTDPRNKRVRDRLSGLSNEFGKKKMDAFVVAVSQMNPQLQTQLLSKLSRTDVSNSSVRKLVNELEGSVNQCIDRYVFSGVVSTAGDLSYNRECSLVSVQQVANEFLESSVS